MAKVGRKPDASRLVERAEGSRLAKKRLKLFLATLADEMSIAEACAELDIGERGFLKRRSQWLQESIEALEPRAVGRPPKTEQVRPQRVEQLEGQVQALRAELKASRVREEIAVTMPKLAERAKGRRKKKHR